MTSPGCGDIAPLENNGEMRWDNDQEKGEGAPKGTATEATN